VTEHLGLAEGAPGPGTDTITMADFLEAYRKLEAAGCWRPRRAGAMRDSMLFGMPQEERLLGMPVRYSPVVARDQALVVSPPVFGHLGQIVVLNPCHDPAYQRRLALLRESLTFLHRLVMG
jgi:hypothetical protein